MARLPVALAVLAVVVMFVGANAQCAEDLCIATTCLTGSQCMMSKDCKPVCVPNDDTTTTTAATPTPEDKPTDPTDPVDSMPTTGAWDPSWVKRGGGDVQAEGQGPVMYHTLAVPLLDKSGVKAPGRKVACNLACVRGKVCRVKGNKPTCVDAPAQPQKPKPKPVAKPQKACNLMCVKDSVCVMLGAKAHCVPKARLGASLSAAFAAGFKVGKASCPKH